MSTIQELEKEIEDKKRLIEELKKQELYRLEQEIRTILVPPSFDELKLTSKKDVEAMCLKFFRADLWFGHKNLKFAFDLISKKTELARLKNVLLGHFTEATPGYQTLSTAWFTQNVIYKDKVIKSSSTANGFYLQFVKRQIEEYGVTKWVFCLLKEGEDHDVVDGVTSNNYGHFILESSTKEQWYSSSSSSESEEFERKVYRASYNKITTLDFFSDI